LRQQLLLAGGRKNRAGLRREERRQRLGPDLFGDGPPRVGAGRSTARRCRCRGPAPGRRRRPAAPPCGRKNRPPAETAKACRIDGSRRRPPSACRLALTGENCRSRRAFPIFTGPRRLWGARIWVRLGGGSCCRTRRQVFGEAGGKSFGAPWPRPSSTWIRTDHRATGRKTSAARIIRPRQFFDSFECRGRNRVVGAPALRTRPAANALDCPRRQARERPINLADRSCRARGDLREAVLHSACARFFDGARPGLGLVPRGPHPPRPDGTGAANYRICQWNVVGFRCPRSRAAVAGRKAGRGRRPARGPPPKTDARPVRDCETGLCETGLPPVRRKAEPGSRPLKKPPPTKKRRQDRPPLISR